MQRFYAGIGSRETPSQTLSLMTEVAGLLENKGFTLRSGGADGADAAFERGVSRKENKEIYLPWRGFNHNPSTLYNPTPSALKMASLFHPAWDRCSQGAQKLHARNCHQVLGLDLQTPSLFILCWTKDGKLAGGTAQAMRIAQHHRIPIINFFGMNHSQVMRSLQQYLK